MGNTLLKKEREVRDVYGTSRDARRCGNSSVCQNDERTTDLVAHDCRREAHKQCEKWQERTATIVYRNEADKDDPLTQRRSRGAVSPKAASATR